MGLGLPALFLCPTGSTHLVEALEAGYSVLTPWEDTKEGVEGSLLSRVATKAIKGNLELPEAGCACRTPNMTTPCPPCFKWGSEQNGTCPQGSQVGGEGVQNCVS